jgi:hypothetical protein
MSIFWTDLFADLFPDNLFPDNLLANLVVVVVLDIFCEETLKRKIELKKLGKFNASSKNFKNFSSQFFDEIFSS